eukprot:TRINITY_DN6196_c0_g1_i1.p1 TRINITY_DN6196_c0_g1~~TRINITY_DN6196_c0_g1_i1.p1  ORF type:complete len:397 (+),score=68.26 TRINITY_DN6196_c0_g1_i1:140-1330(+)
MKGHFFCLFCVLLAFVGTLCKRTEHEGVISSNQPEYVAPNPTNNRSNHSDQTNYSRRAPREFFLVKGHCFKTSTEDYLTEFCPWTSLWVRKLVGESEEPFEIEFDLDSSKWDSEELVNTWNMSGADDVVYSVKFYCDIRNHIESFTYEPEITVEFYSPLVCQYFHEKEREIRNEDYLKVSKFLSDKLDDIEESSKQKETQQPTESINNELVEPIDDIVAVTTLPKLNQQISDATHQFDIATVNEERTLLIVKPDGVDRRLIGEFLHRFERKGFKLVGMKFIWPTKAIIEEHYQEHSEKVFFAELVDYMTSGPVVGIVLEGESVITTCRKMLGATNPLDADLGSIRGDYGTNKNSNLMHASDSIISAKREIDLWFGEPNNCDAIVLDWAPSLEKWSQ